MVISLSAVLVFALAASASPVIEETRHQHDLREHYHHLSYIADFTCHHPQPRSIPVHELLSPYQIRGKAYFPEVTVLHRCDVFAGCCEGGKNCGPLHAYNVHLPFKVTYLEDMGDKHKGEWEMEYYYFDNHTVCGCDHHHGLYQPNVHQVYNRDHDHVHNHVQGHDEHLVYSHKEGYKPVHEEHEHHDELSHQIPERRVEHKLESKKIDSVYITI